MLKRNRLRQIDLREADKVRLVRRLVMRDCRENRMLLNESINGFIYVVF
jgi:hypothetical protein